MIQYTDARNHERLSCTSHKLSNVWGHELLNKIQLTDTCKGVICVILELTAINMDQSSSRIIAGRVSQIESDNCNRGRGTRTAEVVRS